MSLPVAPKGVAGRSTSVILAGSKGLLAADQTLAFLTLTSGFLLDTAALPSGVSVLLDASIAPDETRRLYVLKYVLPGGGDPEAGVTLSFTGNTNYVLCSARLRDADPVTLLDVVLSEAGSRNTAASGGTLTAPGFDPSMSYTRALYFFMKRNVSTGLAISPADEGVVTIARANGDGTNGGAARLCTELIEGDGAVPARTATTSDTTNGWVACTVVVRPKATPVNLWWVGDGTTEDFSAFADTSEATGGIDYLSPQVRSIITAPAGMTDKAYQFAVNGVASNSTQRCESRPSLTTFNEGDEAWFAGKTYLPAGFPTNPTSWQLIMQMKNDASGTPPLELCVEGGQFQLQGGAGHPSGSTPMPVQNLGAATTDQVDAWLFNVLFSSDNAVGRISVWRNGTQVLTNYKPPGGTKYPGQLSYLKIGIYRDPAMSTTGATVVHDDWRAGATRAAVEGDARLAPLYGLDVNHFRSGLNLATAATEGLAFVFAKIGQGASAGQGYGQTLDPQWPTFRDAALAAGLALGGYWYVGDTETAVSQAARCKAWIGDRGIPIALDWEEGGGNWANLSACVTAFRDAGLTVRMLYTRKTYYDANGGGSISALSLALWNARYPTTTNGTPTGLYAAVASDLDTYWQTYGGVDAQILQFSDNATIAGTSPVDADAFNGDEADLATLLDRADVPIFQPSPGMFLPLFPDRVVTHG